MSRPDGPDHNVLLISAGPINTSEAKSDDKKDGVCSRTRLPEKVDQRETFSYEQLLERVGNLGLWQLKCFIILGVCKFTVALHNMVMVFHGLDADHWCAVPELESLHPTQQKNYSIPKDVESNTFSSCTVYSARDYGLVELYENGSLNELPESFYQNTTEDVCHSGWVYDQPASEPTIRSEWDLVCGKEWMVASGQSIYMLGFLVGCLVFGSISDHLGRKTAFVATLTLMAVSGTATAFAPNYTMFAILRFITGSTSAGLSNCLFIYNVENVGRSYRTRVAIGQGVCYSMGNLGLTFVAWLLPGWRNIQLGISVWVFLLFGLFFIIPESPRWLYAEGRIDECEEALHQVAATNRKPYPERAKLVLSANKQLLVNSEESERQPNIRDIMRTPNMRRKTLVLMYEWFMVSFVYYGLSLNAVNLGSNRYLAYSLQAIVELPAKVFGAWIIKHWGRRLSLCFTMTVGGFFCLMTLLPFPADKKWIILTISTAGKFSIGATFNLIYLYSGEIYPTVVRNIGLGSNSTGARVSAILAPYVNMLYMYGTWIPQLIFGTTAMSAGFLALMLPETRNSVLPETLEEGEAFGRNQKFWTLLPPKDVSQD